VEKIKIRRLTMNKTLQALDELVYSIISLIPSWLGMLKSTRTLTVIGTVIAVYYTAMHSGISGTDAVIAYAVEALTGISLVVGKTIRTGAPQNGQDTTLASSTLTIPKVLCPRCGKLVDDRTWCSECNAVLHPSSSSVAKYFPPPALQDVGANESTLYLQWVAFRKMLDWDLTKHDPQIRLVFATDILAEYKKRIDIAWTEELQRTNSKEIILPSPQNFETYETVETFKKRIMDITPNCEWLTIAQDTMLRGYNDYFSGLLWVTRLYEKNINWQQAHSVNEIAEFNYSAVS
jgi:hypothetical protein